MKIVYFVDLWFSKPRVEDSSPSSLYKIIIIYIHIRMSVPIIINPFEKFEIVTLLPLPFVGLNVSMNNSSLFLILSVLSI